MNINVLPSAFNAAEIMLEEFIDLDKFPIHDLTSPKRKSLVNECRAGLDKWGCAHVPNFITDAAIKEMKAEAFRIMDGAKRAHAMVNPYLTADDPSLPNDHPKRYFVERTSAFINSDLLEPQSLLRKLYDSDVVLHFIANCLNTYPIYRWADPLSRNPYSIMKDGDYFPWHFDANDFTISILINEAEKGGNFEYVPNLRNPNDECFDDVKAVLQGDNSRIRVLELKKGDLQLFKGRYSLHRARRTRGDIPRIIALPTYVTNPYIVNRPYHSEAFYGRAMPIHYQREVARLDNLAD